MPISHRHQQPGVFEERTAISGEGGGMEQKGNGATFKDTNLIVVVRDFITTRNGLRISRISRKFETQLAGPVPATPRQKIFQWMMFSRALSSPFTSTATIPFLGIHLPDEGCNCLGLTRFRMRNSADATETSHNS